MSWQDNVDTEWGQWPPPEPRRSNAPWLIAGGVVGLLLAAVCLVVGFFVARPLFLEPTVPATPLLPTLPGQAATETSVAAASLTAPPPDDIPDATDTTAPTAGAPTVGAATVTIPAEAATVTVPAGVTPITSRQVTATRLDTPPAIDGNLSEWALVTPAFASAFRVFNAESWDGSEDLDASWQLGWDNNHLYIAVTVVDNVHVQNQAGNQIFRGDSVDMQIDTNPAAGAIQVNPNTFQFILSPGDFGGRPPSAVRFQGTTTGSIPDAPGHSVILAAQQTGSGYTLEASIPWEDINVIPSNGLVLGLALNANDNDTPGTAVQEVMMSHVSTRTLLNPSSWGTLLLQN